MYQFGAFLSVRIEVSARIQSGVLKAVALAAIDSSRLTSTMSARATRRECSNRRRLTEVRGVPSKNNRVITLFGVSDSE